MLEFRVPNSGKIPRGNSRYIDGEVHTWEKFFHPVLEKDIPALENQCTNSLFLTIMRALSI